MLLILVLGTGVTLYFGVTQTNNLREKEYSAYISGKEAYRYTDLSYSDLFSVWNNSEIGNDINVLLTDGKLLHKGGVSVYPKSKDSYVIIKDGKETGTIRSEISFINLVEDNLYYRQDSTRKLYVYELSTGKSQTVFDGNIGELFATKERLFYIDYVDNEAVYSVGFDGADAKKEVAFPVESFFVCGNYIIALDKERALHEINMENGVSRQLIKGIDAFFLNGNFVFQSGTKFFTCTTSVMNGAELYTSVVPDVKLVGVVGNTIFIQENGQLFRLSGTNKAVVIEDQCLLYTSILPIGNDLFVNAYVNTGTNGIQMKTIILPLSEN